MTGRLRLTVTGAASTDLLLRVVNLLAQRGFVPLAVVARQSDDAMRIGIVIEPAGRHAIEALIEKLRSLVEVEQVSVRGSPATSLDVSDRVDILR